MLKSINLNEEVSVIFKSNLTMSKYSIFIFLLLSFDFSKAQSLYFPPITGYTWETTAPETLGWCTENIEPLYDYLDETNSKAFLVLKNGKIVLEKYFGTFTQDSVWYWASAGKSLTAFMIGIAQQEGYLSLSDTTSAYLGEGWTACTIEQENKITILDQISMTSGLDDGVPDNHCTIDTCLIYKADAGTRWAYHNAPYTLLDSVIYYATGSTLNSYVFNKLSIYTGIYGLYLHIDYNNIFFSNARSMARFGLLALNKGNWNGTAILTDTSYFHAMVNTSQSLNLSYGYLWWLNGKESFMVPGLQLVFPGSLMPSAPDDMYSALGKNGQIIHVVPSQDLVVVRIGDVPGEGDVSILYADTIWQKLNLILCNTDEINSENKSEIKVFPNPASDILFIESKEPINEIKIFNSTGVLFYISDKNNPISLSGFLPGCYFIEIRTGDTYLKKKLIKL